MTKCKKQEKPTYPNIDMQQTGAKMKRLGLILPSVDHLLMLSELLGVHMEELLVKKCVAKLSCDVEVREQVETYRRYIAYYNNLYTSVA